MFRALRPTQFRGFQPVPLERTLHQQPLPEARKMARYPLAITADRRHLVDADGTPFLMQGEAAWSIASNLTYEQAVRYLDDRRAKGFNTILVNLLEHMYAQNAPADLAGNIPFKDPRNFADPNDAYFDHAQRVLDAATERGFYIVLTPAYIGYRLKHETGNTRAAGWYEELLNGGVENSTLYGAYLAKRFGRYDNIMWCIGGDFHPEGSLPMLDALACSLKANGAKGLFSGHVHPEYSPIESFPGVDWLDVNNTYTYYIPHLWMYQDYNRDPVWPFFFMESTYENEHNSSHQQFRRQAYWSVPCGAFGHITGNYPIWLFGPGWEDQLDSTGSVAMARWGDFFRQLPWADLVPDLDKKVIVGGLGEDRGLDRVTTAITGDKHLAVAYLPVHRPIAVDLDALDAASVSVKWFDPVTGTSLSGGVLNAKGLVVLTPPFDEDTVITLTRVD
jgi:hypothetical protein